MKAMILAAGFGTRLLPYTENTPKPLFTIKGRPLLDIIICNLQRAGFNEIIINTHHLHDKIASFVKSRSYNIPVFIRYEPEILDTGGAIKNVSDFWGKDPFIVINSDIVTDIDLAAVYRFHINHGHPVTMVLCNSDFNKVSVDKDFFVRDFKSTGSDYFKKFTFTGIQVLNPEVLDFIPERVFFSIIDSYMMMINQGKKIKAFMADNFFWKDMGTLERYMETNVQIMAAEAFRKIKPDLYFDGKTAAFDIKKLAGDGSDRLWSRISRQNISIIMAEHGIKAEKSVCEAESFVAIGNHLYNKKIPVPEVYKYDTFAGLVLMEDFGDLNFQQFIANIEKKDKIISCYKEVVEILINMSIKGMQGFDTSWTCQTEKYDQDLIIEKECRYFTDAFLKGYLGLDISFDDFKKEFIWLAEQAVKFSVAGFMHRDFQSRNIMVKNGKYHIIDFQGGRVGPVQYDLASLLIDPYVELSRGVREILLGFCMKRLALFIDFDKEKFKAGFKYCSLTRNFQILGAFGYLSKIKGKKKFEKYIPPAVRTLKDNLAALKERELSGLKKIGKIIYNCSDDNT